jgi:hypothetical protein
MGFRYGQQLGQQLKTSVDLGQGIVFVAAFHFAFYIYLNLFGENMAHGQVYQGQAHNAWSEPEPNQNRNLLLLIYFLHLYLQGVWEATLAQFTFNVLESPLVDGSHINTLFLYSYVPALLLMSL